MNGGTMKNAKTQQTLRYVIPIALMVIGAAFIVIGIFDKEIVAVLSKATALCRECVGIG